MSLSMQIPEEMRKKYLERRARDLVELGSALEAREFELFRKVGHQLKGNAVTFGYDSLAALGQQMESAADAGDAVAAGECVASLQKWLEAQPS